MALGKDRPFNKDAYTASDTEVKKVIIPFLRNEGYDVYENPDTYGIDLSCNMFELEQRTIWEGNTFPFKTIHIPARKSKFFKFKLYYFIVNKDMSYFLSVHSSTITKYKIEEVKRRDKTDSEYFYNIPISEFKLYKIKGNNEQSHTTC
jgi:hypothetical protein